MLSKQYADLDMFYKARIKLTLWYLLIIMSISVMFSLVIFRSFEMEIRRFRRPNPEIVEEITQRVQITLAGINITILVVSGVLGYLLAGKTLRPIQEMIDGQIRFVADASHELRTPLTALRSSFEVFLRSKSETLVSSKTLITESLEEVGKLQSLSESLLQLTAIENKMVKLDLNSVILEAIRRTSVKNIKYKERKVIIVGNHQALVSLFMILIDNASKYSKAKTEIQIISDNSQVSIVDKGIGISQKDLPHIFDRFYRADSSRSKNRISGYGLGLSIAKKIADEHHASITVESQLDKGSTFQVSFNL